jgi:hypothetical protein
LSAITARLIPRELRIMISPTAFDVFLLEVMTRRECKCMRLSKTAAPPIVSIQQM